MLAIGATGTFFLSGIAAGTFFFGLSISELIQSASKIQEGNESIVRYLLIVQSISIFILPALIIARSLQKENQPFIRWGKIKTPASILIASLIIVLALPLINLFAEMNKLLIDSIAGADNWMARTEANAQDLTEFILNTSSTTSLWYNLATIAIVPAIAEELFFRGLIQTALQKRIANVHICILLTAFFFSALHFQFYGFIPRLIMGLYLGYLYVWFDNLLVPATVHFVNNATAVILYYAIHNGILPEYIETIGSNTETIGISIVSIACVVFLFWLLKKNSGMPLPKKIAQHT